MKLDETLRLLGIARARGLVAALSTDADNLFVLLSAKGLNPRIYVAARAAEEGAEDEGGQRMQRVTRRQTVVKFAGGHRADANVQRVSFLCQRRRLPTQRLHAGLVPRVPDRVCE